LLLVMPEDNRDSARDLETALSRAQGAPTH
jgi:hypothetical protein